MGKERGGACLFKKYVLNDLKMLGFTKLRVETLHTTQVISYGENLMAFSSF